MAISFFQFKKFTVYHDKCAMKVGTDGVLLGAWADVEGKKRILDVGTGSGLISLMLAQRSAAVIDAIDIENTAFIQATGNFERSVYKNRINAFHTSLEMHAQSVPDKYDLIVSNPPYFINSLQSPDQKKNLARHNNSLTLDTLLSDSLKLLSDGGIVAIVLPYDQEAELDKQASRSGLFFKRKTRVIPSAGNLYKRILAEMTANSAECIYDELTIEKSRHQYTDQYTELTKDFYLKM